MKHPNYYIRWQETAALLLTEVPSIEMINQWYSSQPNGLQAFCVNHAIQDWQTGIGIIDAIQGMLDEAHDNDNLDTNWEPT